MPASEIHAEWAKRLAAELIETDATPPADIDDEQRLALAWALKDAAVAAWGAKPSDVVLAAEALSKLHARRDAENHSVPVKELGAITEWVNGIAALTRGKMTDAVTHLDCASNAFQTLGQRGYAAHAQVPKIMALSLLGEHAQATASGLATRKELIDLSELHAAAKVSGNLGSLFCQCSKYEEALPYFCEAETFFDQVDDQNNALGCAIGRARVYEAVGKFDEALSTYAQIVERARQHQLPMRLCVATEAVALVNLAQGAFRQALAGFETVRQHYDALGMPQNVAVAEKQLADTYFDLRLLPEALSLFDRAIERFNALEMPVEQAWALTQRGRALAALARPEDMVTESLRRAWDLFTKQGVSAGQATVLLARAELALAHDSGQFDPILSETLAKDAAAAFAVSGLVTGKVQADVARAYALLQRADVVAASSLFETALAATRSLQLRSIGVRCQVGLGLVATVRGDIQAATMAFESAVATSEEQRSVLPGDDLRSAFLLDQLRPYEELLRIALNAFDSTTSAEAAAGVLVQLERFRARALGERLGEVRSDALAITSKRTDDAHSTEQTATTRSESALRAQLRWLYRRRQKLIDDGDDAHAATDDSHRVERELLEAARRRRLTTTPTHQTPADTLAGDIARFDAAALQSALGASEALVEYGVIDDELFACVVTSQSISLHRRMADWPDVLSAITAARFQIETCRSGAGVTDQHLPLLNKRAKKAMTRVHDLIWAPLSDQLAECSRVLVVPHEQLGSLPFAALYDGEVYLAQRVNVAMVASARVALFGLARLPTPIRRALVLGEASRLAHAAAEVAFVAALFEDARILDGSNADAASLRKMGASADVLHLACHAEFRSDNPMFSALHLADGPFTVHDAETLRLPQGVVVLSACETGVSEYSRGDEMIGLVRAFLVAGASRVVASLWAVDDAVTRQFMATFYFALRGGDAPSAALHAAQMAVMKTHPHPFHWAAFTLYGGW